jgi:DNA-binding PadR family transcriptional regulator
MGHGHHEHHEHHDHFGHHEHHEGPGGRMLRGPGHHGRGRFGGDRGGWGGRRMRRGDVRRSILLALKDEPAHGYEVMRRLEEMSGGLWQPSPGSIYPHLQMLEDEGLVTSTDVDGTRTFTLTESGRAEAEADPRLPWESDGEGASQARELRSAMGQLFMAAKQLAGAGEQSQVERGIAIIQKARKELYSILAED